MSISEARPSRVLRRPRRRAMTPGVTIDTVPARLKPQEDGPAKVLLVGSNGGHLAQMLSLAPWWMARERHWVTFPTPDAKSRLVDESVTWAHYPTTRNIPNLVRNTFLAAKVLRRERPELVVSTGAGVALPFFLAAKVAGIPTAYVEVYDRLDSRTLTGRLCRPLSTRFMVQWEQQRALYAGSEVVGRLL